MDGGDVDDLMRDLQLLTDMAGHLEFAGVALAIVE